jgi:hypothetical protein
MACLALNLSLIRPFILTPCALKYPKAANDIINNPFLYPSWLYAIISHVQYSIWVVKLHLLQCERVILYC